MKSSKIAWVLGAVAAFGLGMAAEGCSSSSGGGTGPGVDGGGTGKDSGGGKKDTGTPGIDGGAPGIDGGTDAKCYKEPKAPYKETKPGVYCPFSQVGDAGTLTCTGGKSCCVTPESAGTPSTCNAGTSCPVTGSTRIQCEGTPDCAASGQICCGYGKIDTQAPQPGCGDGGSTIPSYPYVSGFNYGPSGVKGTGGSFCATTCLVAGDGGPLSTFQVCSQTSECPSGQTCTGIDPTGVGIGYCANADGTAGTGGSGSGSGGTDAGSGSGSDAGSGSGSGTDAGSGSGS